MANRLEFDDELMEAICRPSPGPRRAGRFLFWTAASALAFAGAIAAAVALVRMPLWPRSEPLAPLCTALVDALRAGRPDQALSVCADSGPGRQRLLEDNQRLALRFPGAAADHARVPCETFLAGLLERFAADGVALDGLRPLAFGGVRAKVFDPERMDAPAVAVTGELYFAAGDAVYALELTARQCGPAYVVTDFWKCGPIEAAPAVLESHSQERFHAFRQEQPPAGGSVLVQKPRHVFLPLEPSAS